MTEIIRVSVPDYETVKQYLEHTFIHNFTLDLDNTNLPDVKRLSQTLANMFNSDVLIYRTRKGHYHLQQYRLHTLLDNLLIRLLAHDDAYRIQMDALRMACQLPTLSNRLFDKKLVYDYRAKKHIQRKSRNARVFVCKIIPEHFSQTEL